MSIHNRGLDGKRPVHPRCDAIAGDMIKQCRCELLWAGAQSEDFGPMEAVERKRAMRRQSMPVLGRGAAPDADEHDEYTGEHDSIRQEDPTHYTEVSAAQSIQLTELELSGFWNRAEEYAIRPVWHVEQDRIAAFNDIQAKWGSEFAHAWLSNVAHGYRLPRTQEQFCWLKSRDYL